MELPKALADLVEALGTLPGVGSRTAERYAYYLLKQDSSQSKNIASKLDLLHEGVGYCKKTYALVPKDEELSRYYTDPSRDKTLVMVVAEPLDIFAIEKIGHYHGTYHVLGGLISPIDGVSPEQLKVKELQNRIKDDNVSEIIVATNASVEGESTALYLQKQLEGLSVKLSRLARGLPVGIDLEYADHITLGRALEGRTAL